MPIYTIFNQTLEQLLGEPVNDDELVYHAVVKTLENGILRPKRYQISLSQAKAAMRAIVGDEAIAKAIREGISRTQTNPNGNKPVGGTHPVDPAVDLIRIRALSPALGVSPPIEVTLYFVGKAYEYYRRLETTLGC